MTDTTGRPRMIRDFLSALDKAIRGMRMYKGEGAVVDQLTAELHRAGDALVAEGPVTLRVTPIGLVYEGAPVTDPELRVPYLFRMYLDGVRELSFLPGLGSDELDRLVAALSVDPRGDDDAVTLLWAAELNHVQYYAVDSFTAGIAQAQDGASLAGQRARLPAAGSGGDMEVALSSDDLRVLRTDDLAAWVRLAEAPARPEPAQVAAVAAVREAWHAQADPARFLTIATRATAATGTGSGPSQPSPMVLGVFDALVATRDILGATSMLDRVAGAQADSSPALRALRDAMTTPARMVALAPLVADDHARLVPVLARMVEPARDGLLSLLTALPAGDAEAALRGVLEQSGIDLTPLFLRRLSGDDTDDILAAIESLGRIGSPAAVRALCTALESSLGAVRSAALHAMHGAYDESARVSLGHALRDPDKGNRMLALQILRDSGDARVGWLLLAACDDESFPELPEDEQRALVGALASFHDPRTLGWFAELLTHRTAVGRRDEIPLQLLAVEALVAMTTPEARQALQDARGRWLLAPVVKEAIGAALSRKGGPT